MRAEAAPTVIKRRTIKMPAVVAAATAERAGRAATAGTARSALEGWEALHSPLPLDGLPSVAAVAGVLATILTAIIRRTAAAGGGAGFFIAPEILTGRELCRVMAERPMEVP